MDLIIYSRQELSFNFNIIFTMHIMHIMQRITDRVPLRFSALSVRCGGQLSVGYRRDVISAYHVRVFGWADSARDWSASLEPQHLLRTDSLPQTLHDLPPSSLSLTITPLTQNTTPITPHNTPTLHNTTPVGQRVQLPH